MHSVNRQYIEILSGYCRWPESIADLSLPCKLMKESNAPQLNGGLLNEA